MTMNDQLLLQQRRDDTCSAVIDQGLQMQARVSTVCAIEYLKAHNVNAQIITRVLAYPELRRQNRH